jgi:CP family cyanate transporter-like MFS transporter
MAARDDRADLMFVRLWLLGFSTYCPMLCIPPMVHVMRQEFHVSYEALAILFSTPVTMVLALSIPSGLLGDKIGARKTVVMGAAVIAVGCLMRALSINFTQLLAFTALYGLGFSLVFPNLLKFVGLRFPQERVGLAMGVYATGITIGATVAVAATLPIVFPVFNTIQGTLFIWGLPSALSAVLWLLSKDPYVNAPCRALNAKGEGRLPPLWKNRNMWSIALLLLLNDIHYYTWSAWTPSLLTMKGASPDLAALISSSAGWSTIPAMFLMPWASYKFGLRRPFMWGSALLLAVASCAAHFIPVPLGWPLMAVVGITTGGTFPMILALPSEMLPRESAAAASGMIISLGYIGAFVGPWLAGRILDATGRLDLDLALLTATALIWAAVSFVLPEAQDASKSTSMARKTGR